VVRFGKELAVKKKMPRSFGNMSRMLKAVCIEALYFWEIYVLLFETYVFKRNLFTVLKNAHLISLS